MYYKLTKYTIFKIGVDELKSIIEELGENDEYFDLNNKPLNPPELTTLLNNKDYFNEKIASINLQEMNSISDFLNYLFFKKLDSIANIYSFFTKFTKDEDKIYFEQIYNLVSQKNKNINNKMVVAYINKNYKDIFTEKYHKYQLPEVTLSLIAPVQSGINRDVFAFLSKRYNYLLLEHFQDFQCKFENDPELFDMLFNRKDLEEIQELSLDHVLSIFYSIHNKSKSNLKDIVKQIIEQIVIDIEYKYRQNLNFMETRELFIFQKSCNQVYDFLKKIKHYKANTLYEINLQIDKKVTEEIKTHGHRFEYKIPLESIINELKGIQDYPRKMLSITHEHEEFGMKSMLAIESQGPQGLHYLIGSNIPHDEYFTFSHQQTIHLILSIGSKIISTIWHDEEFFSNYIGWYAYTLNFISDKINLSNKLGDDIELLYTMLQPVILCDDEKNKDLIPFCYGAGMYICTLIENLLRSVYIWLKKDQMYIATNSVKLKMLLSENNDEMANIFGKGHLKNLSFFLITIGENRIGWNIRNSLAHWSEIDKHNLNSTMVAKLMYLYTDIVNTLFLYFLNLNEDDSHNNTSI